MEDREPATGESIRIRDGLVLRGLKVLHDACWRSSQLGGRPSVKLINLLLREIEELEDAPFVRPAPTLEQIKATYDASHPRATG